MAKSSIVLSAKSLAVKPIDLAFFARPTDLVARELLGKILVSRSRGAVTAGRIVETEAYVGGIDPAAHCFRGVTPRSSVMFGPPGRAYVYFIYGMYEMLNFVTEPEGTPGAVLIRALEPLQGVSTMQRRRRLASPARTKLSERDLCSGPGKLCRAMGIPLAWNRKSLDSSELCVVDDGYAFSPECLLASPRVGIRSGNEHYWRYFPAQSPFVSRARENKKARCFHKS